MSNLNINRASLAAVLKHLLDGQKIADQYVYGITNDSRKVGKNFLFIATCGNTHDARNYIYDAIKNGVSAIIYEASKPLSNSAFEQLEDAKKQGIFTLAVSNCHLHLGTIAANFYMFPSNQLNVVGVTGTNGKSSCVNIIAQALNKHKHKAGVIGTLGWGFLDNLKPNNMTTPDAIALQSYSAYLRDHDAQSLVLEVSSHALSQNRIQGLNIDIALFSNLTRDHLDYHETFDAYANAKLSLFTRPNLGYAVINADDDFSETILNNISKKVEVILVSQKPCNKDYKCCYASDILVNSEGVSFVANTPWGNECIKSSLHGRFQITNLLLAIPALVLLGVPFKESCRYLSSTQTIPGRAQIFGGNNIPTVFVDYAHTPAALSTILQHARHVAKGKVWCVFGCGGQRDQGKRSQMGMIAEKIADEVILTDDNPRQEDPVKIVNDILSGIVCSWAVTIEHDRASAIKLAISSADKDDIVVIAGKGHENVQIIDDEYFSHSDSEHVTKQLDLWKPVSIFNEYIA